MPGDNILNYLVTYFQHCFCLAREDQTCVWQCMERCECCISKHIQLNSTSFALGMLKHKSKINSFIKVLRVNSCYHRYFKMRATKNKNFFVRLLKIEKSNFWTLPYERSRNPTPNSFVRDWPPILELSFALFFMIF